MPPNPDGPYDVVLLRLDRPSPRTGRAYSALSLRKLIETEAFRQRTDAGYLQGEWGTPMPDKLGRIPGLQYSRVCAHFDDVYIKDHKLLAKLFPSGPLQHYLKSKEYRKDFDVSLRMVTATPHPHLPLEIRGIIAIDVIPAVPEDKQF